MGRQDRIDFYRSSRDFGNILDGGEAEGEADRDFIDDGDFIDDDDQERLDDFIDYDDDDGGGGYEYEEQPQTAPQEEQDEHLAEEVQEYLNQREKLKELERRKLREKLKQEKLKGSSSSDKKSLPFNNYGSFFGPSEPVVARRIIQDARAREEAYRVAKLAKQQEMSKKQSGQSKSNSESRASEIVARPSKPINQAALKAQRLKEARDYSFLFNDEDPSTSAPRDDAHGAAVKNQDHDRSKQSKGSGKPMSGSAFDRGSSMKVPSSGVKLTKPNISMQHKGQERQLKPQLKPPPARPQKPPEHPPERPHMPKAKAPDSRTGLTSNHNRNSSVPHSSSAKTMSGPGQPGPAQHRPVQVPGSNGKKVLPPSSAAQLRNIVASRPKIADPRQLPMKKPDLPRQGKVVPPQKPASANGERKTPQMSMMRPEQRRPGLPTAGQLDQRRAPQSGAPVKHMMKPPAKLPDVRKVKKRRFGDPFMDDDMEDDPIGEIRKLFGYNPNRYRDEDDDDRNMEADFRTIQMEEKRSARIAKEEDDRELALIEAEERVERERAKKKRKLQGK